jgi:hypothetical protein
MMLGKSPEEVTEWSYGNAPMQVPQMTRVPQFKAGRAESLADTLFAAQAAAPVARMAPQAARALAPSAGALALEAAARTGMPVHGLGVVKPKGGNWLAGSVENATGALKRENIPDPELLRLARENGVNVNEEAVATNDALRKWIDTKLGRYIKNEMGTPEDPIRALAEQGRLHVDPEQLNFNPEVYGSGWANLEGQTLMAQHPTAKSWEGASDLTINPMKAGSLTPFEKYTEVDPWLAKVPPETSVYGLSEPSMLSSDLGFNHMLDELRNAVNPESGLPRELLWKYGDLDKVTVPQAVQRVHDINEWRAAQKAEANAARANNAAAFTHKDYEDAPYKWVELKQPETEKITELPEGWRVLEDSNNGHKFHYVVNEHGGTIPGSGFTGKTHEEAVANTIKGLNSNRETQALEDALKYEGETMGHCVGGYCPDVLEGKSRIFSLRNKKTGEPHVTIETAPYKTGQWLDKIPEQEYDELLSKYKQETGSNSTIGFPSWASKFAPVEESIVQIKGKANKAPKEEYLPFVQDFVRSGKWSDVGDYGNTGLIDTENAGSLMRHMQDVYGKGGPELQQGIDKFNAAVEQNPEGLQRHMTRSEMLKFLGMDKPEGFAEGGLVEPPLPAAEYSPLEVDYIIGNVMSGQHEPKYAEGGSVETAHIPYDEAKISSLVNALREELHA